MSNNKNSNLILGLIVCVIAVLFFVAGFLVSRLLNGGGDPTFYDMDIAQNETVRVTHTETIHVEQPTYNQPQMLQPGQRLPEVQQPVAPSFRVTPRNLDLQVTLNGIKYYFSVDEWDNLSSSVRNSCTKRGVVIDYNGVRFVVKLTMELHGSGFTYEDAKSFTWDEAKLWVSNMSSNWRLPTKDEGTAMADQYKSVCSAIKAFGGDSDPAWWYWTSTESSASGAWYFYLGVGGVNNRNKSTYGCVRAVRAI